MTGKNFRLLFIFGLITLNYNSLRGQVYHLKGKVVERFYKSPLPFTHIIINDDEAEAVADVEGKFEIEHSSPIKTLKFKQYQYRQIVYDLADSTDTLTAELNKYTLFEFEDKSDVYADRIIYNVLKNKRKNNTEHFQPHSFRSYNKLIIETNKLTETKKLLEKNLKIFGIKFKPFKKDHNLFLVESVTEKRYLDDLNQREEIIASKISGINETSIYTISSLLLPESIYEDYTKIATMSFLSPLNRDALSNYYFKLIDTINIDNSATYILKFTPARKNIDALKGLLFIDSRDYAVNNFILSPAYDSPSMEVAQTYEKIEGKYFPKTTRTEYLAKKYPQDNIRVNIVARTERSDIRWRKDLRVWDFDDVILRYKKSANQENERYWDTLRVHPLTEREANTYSFYDTIGSIKKFERYSQIGEGVYNGIIPIKMINVEVDRILSANQYEGFRIGIGGHTNNLLSERYSGGGYIGYGTRDGKIKYGLNGRILVDKNTDFTVAAAYSKDLEESAGVNLYFDRRQFSTESLRDYMLTMLDRVNSMKYYVSIKPIRYFYLSSGLEFEQIKPLYSYQYKEEVDNQYTVAEFKLGVKISFGEQFIQSPQNKFILTSKYPIFWLEYKKGFQDVFIGGYDYKKWDLKFQYSFKRPGIGRQTLQVTAGIAQGDVPYFKLYNMQGSWRTLSVVIHNSFETMRYNEFLSSRYLAVHYAHDLGKIIIRKPKISPGLEVLHSFGIGDLANKEDHKMVNFKTLEKGYFESGLFIYDIITFSPFGVKTGLGTGMFLRYGPNAREKFLDNFLYKLGLSFGL